MGRHRTRLLGLLSCAIVVAAACGDDDDVGGGADPASATTAAADSTSAVDVTTAGSTATSSATTTETDDAAAASGGADDAVEGQGAAAFERALRATADAPLAADDSLAPFVIGMPNLEGDPAGSFPDVREGAEAAVQLINERLGGIGADIEAGVGGRPVELAYCGHLVNQNEAQTCANEVADANPNVIVTGLEIFTPMMYPLFAEYPIVEMLPASVADADQPGVYAPFGGCATSWPAAARHIAENKGHDRLAVIWGQTAAECWRDVGERFYEYYADTIDNFEAQGFPFNPGEIAGYPAVVQQAIDYLEGAENAALYLPAQAADCAAFIQALRGAGVEGQIYTATGCNDEAVLGLPEAEGVAIEWAGYIVDQPELYSEFIQFELDERERAIEAYGPETPVSSLMRQMFSAVMFAYQVANDVAADGGDLDDRTALRAAVAAVDNYHVVGYRPISCVDNTAEYESICNRRTSFAIWDGESFTLDPALTDGYVDTTELLVAVEEANPRQP